MERVEMHKDILLMAEIGKFRGLAFFECKVGDREGAFLFKYVLVNIWKKGFKVDLCKLDEHGYHGTAVKLALQHHTSEES